MVRRVFWVALGATVGVLVVRQVTRTAESLTPGSLADRANGAASGLTGAVRDFLDDVRENAQHREYELYEALGVEQPPELEAGLRATEGRTVDED